MSAPVARSNRLARQTSPYLLQHAHNPVDWYAWGSEAFDAARAQDKPIFLSVGYSTCYWCHVMERQCFENDAIARLMNERFVSVKVDREERPDVDELYMTAVQLMTGRGGWPMSVFLTPPGAAGADDPGLKPFFAGTYFPPEPAHGMPGFPAVLTALSDAWRRRRPEVLDQAEQVAEGLRRVLAHDAPAGELSPASVDQAANQLLRGYDPEHGGFSGPGGPKFPQPCNLAFLLAVQHHTRDADVGQALAHTLERMARGGMYDQIAGGFHRYSTDERWLVPHFEKMLYDQAQLIEVYLEAQRTLPHAGDPAIYPRVIRQTCDYVLREMTDPGGAFWSAQDAEVDGLEGASYLWTPQQVRAALDGASAEASWADLALALYGLDQGPNFQDPHHPDAGRFNVLFVPDPFPALAARLGLALDQLLELKSRIDARLLHARNQRPQPRTDDKVLAGWNGMMIAALAQAGGRLPEPRYLDAARRAARFILQRLHDAGGLRRVWCKGQAAVPAVLEDYAFLIHGLLALHRAEPQGLWLGEALQLADRTQRDFGADAGGCFDTRANQPDLIVRARGRHDGAVPAGNSQMAHNLLDLHVLTGEGRWLDAAVRTLGAAAESLGRLGPAMAHMQHALLRALAVGADRLATTSVAAAAAVRLDVQPAELDLAAGEAAISLTIRVPPGNHISGPQVAQAGLTPTALTLQHAPGLELAVRWPPPRRVRLPLAPDDLPIYDRDVRVEATVFRRGPVPPDARPRLVLTCQACTETACLAPQRIEVPLSVC